MQPVSSKNPIGVVGYQEEGHFALGASGASGTSGAS